MRRLSNLAITSSLLVGLLLTGVVPTLNSPAVWAAPEKPAVEWENTYGGEDRDGASSVIQTSDGGFALAGHTWSYGAGYSDLWLVKTDPSGNLQWARTYGGGGEDCAQSLVQTSDGGFAMAGLTASYGAGGYDFCLVKTDSSGNLQWENTYGGENCERAHSVVQTSDGGFALAGTRSTLPYGGDESGFWLVKTDRKGNLQWEKTYGGRRDDYASVVQTSDGGFALAGTRSTRPYGGSESDFWLVKTDSSGNLQWEKTYGGENWDAASSVVQTSDGGFAIAGWTESYGAGEYDFWLVRTDSSGNLHWSEICGGEDSDGASSVVQTSDGGFAIAGRTWSYGTGEWDFWLVKLGGGKVSIGEKVTPMNWPLIGGIIAALAVIGALAMLYRRKR